MACSLVRNFFQATHENLYKYYAKEDYFGDENDQTFEITIYFKVHCKSGTIKYMHHNFQYIHDVHTVSCNKIYLERNDRMVGIIKMKWSI